jgi:hypothetical protein
MGKKKGEEQTLGKRQDNALHGNLDDGFQGVAWPSSSPSKTVSEVGHVLDQEQRGLCK